MKTKFVLGAVLLASLTGCASNNVFNRERPDEFAVTKAPPLAVPADLSTLPAPQPGAQKPAADTKQDMLDAMFGAPKQ